MATFIEQLSDALAAVTEKYEAEKAKCSYTEDQLALAESKVSVLEAQVSLFEKAQKVRQSGDYMNSPKANAASLFSAAKAEQNTDTSSAPEAPEFNK